MSSSIMLDFVIVCSLLRIWCLPKDATLHEMIVAEPS